jgi:hypothetical protein
MAVKKRVTYPIKKMGKYCGYEEFQDGSIKVAPMYAGDFHEISMDEQAIQNLIKACMAQCHEIQKNVERRKREFFKNVAEDYSLDMDTLNWRYNMSTQRLTAVPFDTDEK